MVIFAIMSPDSKPSHIRTGLAATAALAVGLAGAGLEVTKTVSQVEGRGNIVECPSQNPHPITEGQILVVLKKDGDDVVRIGGTKYLIGPVFDSLDVRAITGGLITINTPSNTQVNDNPDHSLNAIDNGLTPLENGEFLYNNQGIVYDVVPMTNPDGDVLLDIKASC